MITRGKTNNGRDSVARQDKFIWRPPTGTRHKSFIYFYPFFHPWSSLEENQTEENYPPPPTEKSLCKSLAFIDCAIISSISDGNKN